MAEATATDITAPEEGATNRTTGCHGRGQSGPTFQRSPDYASDPASAAHCLQILGGGANPVIGLISILFSQQATGDDALCWRGSEAEKASPLLRAPTNSGIQVSASDPTTGEILVPTSDYHTARMQLAAQGLQLLFLRVMTSISEIPMGSSRTVENVRLKQSQRSS